MRNGIPTPRDALVKEADLESTGTWSIGRDFSGFHRVAQLATELAGTIENATDSLLTAGYALRRLVFNKSGMSA